MLGRRLFTLLSAVSLALGLATCVLWVRSHYWPAGSVDRIAVTHLRTGDRLTIRSEKGRFWMFAPPAEPPAAARTRDADGRTAESIAAELTDAGVRWGYEDGNHWEFRGKDYVRTAKVYKDGPRLIGDADRLVAGHDMPAFPGETVYPVAELVPPLLRALDDPTRFVAAHVALAVLFDHDGTGSPTAGGPAVQSGWEARSAESYVQVFAGLRAELERDPTVMPREESTPGGEVVHHRSIARIGRAQLPAVRDYWHAHLDGPAGSVSHAAVAAGFGVLPLLWAAARYRSRATRRRRQRGGCCVACGYDLRGSPGRCPECGAGSAGSPDLVAGPVVSGRP